MRINRRLALVAALAIAAVACSSDPTASQEYVDLQQQLATTTDTVASLQQEVATTTDTVASLNQQLEDVTAERDILAQRLPEPSDSASATADMVMKAWASADPADIEAVYSPDVRMEIDKETYASDRDEIADVITEAKGIGNTYKQIGPVAEYVGPDGDTYIATLVAVTGIAHPKGTPVIGFYRVHDGKVIRHIFMEAMTY